MEVLEPTRTTVAARLHTGPLAVIPVEVQGLAAMAEDLPTALLAGTLEEARASRPTEPRARRATV